MPTPNERILSREIEHALRVQGAANRIARQVLAALGRLDNETENALAGGIARALRAARPLDALEALFATFAAINRRAVAAAFRAMVRAIRAFAGVEVAYLLQALGEAVGRALTGPTSNALGDAVRRMIVLGETLAEQEERFAAYRLRRVVETVRIGVLGGKNLDEILSELREPRGAFEDARRALETVTRTNVPAAADVGRNRVYRLNPGVVVGQFWSAVLDNRTTPVCRANDGATRVLLPSEVERFEETGFAAEGGEDQFGPFDGVPWSNGYRGPYPAHPGERSILVPLVNRDAPDKLTFEEWLEMQSEYDQERILGPSRFALWKSGKFELRDFVNDRGKALTLAELRAQDAKAFDSVVEEADGA